MEREEKITLIRIIISGILLAVTFLPVIPQEYLMPLCIVNYVIIGADIVFRAVKNIAHGEVFDENFLMVVATVGALIIGEYAEAVAVMLFYQIGELFQDMAVEKSRESISSLMDIRPDYANIEKDGELVQVSPESVEKGSIIIVKPGEKIPLDGAVLEGASSLNTTALTGESLPRDVEAGDDVISGCVNMTSLLKIRTTNTFGESTVSKILELVENSDKNKADTEKFITRFARIYTPVVVIGAVLFAIIPSLITGDWMTWLGKALIFLVISCPCALVVSIPLTFFAGVGGASRYGILVKGTNYLEELAKLEVVVFDKTGTLTKGNFTVVDIHPEVISSKELLELAALAECDSDHPIAQSLRAAHKKPVERERVESIEDFSGHGIRATVDGREIYVGNDKLMKQIGVDFKECERPGTIIHVALKDEYLGHIVIADEIKPQSKNAISRLKSLGVKKTVMLTGDRKEVGESTAKEIGLDEVCTELLPADKVSEVERLLKGKSEKGVLAFVGDGINDAPVLKRADVGIAMGALGSDAAIEAADVVLMDDDPEKIAKAVKVSSKTLRIVKQNIVFALSIKALFVLLAAFGLCNMWEAVFADVGVALLAILNALRAMRVSD